MRISDWSSDVCSSDLLMIARGYSVFANGGFRITPWFIDEVRDRDNQVIFKEKPATACPSCVGTGGSQAVAVSNVVDGFNLGPVRPEPAKPAHEANEAPAPAATAPPPEDFVPADRQSDG